MIPFLYELAHEVRTSYGTQLDEVCVVFQNRRACLYFKHYLKEMSEGADWSPTVLTIEDFVLELNPVQIVEPVMLLFEFYTVYRKKGGDDSFEQFAQWGENLLKDFDEIDAYLVQTDKLFRYLNEAKAIEQWDPDGKALTEFQRHYLRFWESFEDLYRGLHEHLTRQNKAYKGMALRQAAETIEDRISNQSWRPIIFAGFNALSLSEEKIFKTLITLGRARVIWDMDAYYVRNEDHEAGHYLRKYLREWKIKDAQWEKEFLMSEKKNIHIIGVSKQVGQAKVAGDLAQKLQHQNASMDKTAVILADETLLFPMLHSIPDSIGKTNVSMGLSLKFTSLFSLIEALFDLQENIRPAHETDGDQTLKFYYRDIIAVLSHPLLLWADQRNEKPFHRRLIRHMVEHNILYLSPSELNALIIEMNPSYTHTYFQIWSGTSDALQALTNIALLLKDLLSQGEMTQKHFELESLSRFYSVVLQLQALLITQETEFELKSLRTLLSQMLTSLRIPFSGEPLEGLQIMGMLETRTVDFENVIILSVNENTLPSSKAQQSMIPFDIKKTFQLPTYKEKDAIFAYNFYRAIQRAKNIYLIYNTETDEFGKGEKSRFITQILNELPRHNSNIKSEEIQKSFLSPAWGGKEKTDAFEIIKNEVILTQLDTIASTGLSPSALNKYINCSLQFYLSYVVKLKESDEIEETIEANTFGSAVHSALESLFRPFEGVAPEPSDIEEMHKQITSLLHKAFKTLTKNGNLQYGKNHLLMNVAVKLVENFLKYEKKRFVDAEKSGTAIRILALEKEVTFDMNLQLNDGTKIVKLKGKMDRIESAGEDLLVIDYKTGKVAAKDLKVDSFSELSANPDLAKSFQLLMYSYIYARASGLTEPRMTAAIYPFKKLSEGLIPLLVDKNEKISAEMFDRFEELLKNLLIQLLDPNIPFTQTDELQRCRYCAFVSLCRRD